MSKRRFVITVLVIITIESITPDAAENVTNQQLLDEVNGLKDDVRSLAVGLVGLIGLTNSVNRLENRVDDLQQRMGNAEDKLNPSVTRCPVGWTRFRSSCYGFGSDKVTWGDAQEICRVYGGHLAEIDSQAENEYIYGIAGENGYEDFWAGALDVFSDGLWLWATDGRPVSGFSDWNTGQRTANDGGSQDCLVLHKSSEYKWHDAGCYGTKHFLCEVRLKRQDA